MEMPKPDAEVISRRKQIIKAMSSIVSDEGLIIDAEGMRAYDHDGLMAYKAQPLIVVLPETTREISRILKYCHENNVKIVPRGAGTGLSGGALPLADAITLGLGKFKKILEIDFDNRTVVAQPGVTNSARSVRHLL